ncbi:unnamed protein product [Orchesella dallaii]|uniref:Glutamate-gated chloride channel n=1 Tax=Orchesella dallaii TaxID=48710 RepID=A0ABP1R0F7_9HEXA
MNLKTVIIFIFATFAINETTAQKDRINAEAAILEGLIPNFNKLARMRPVSRENGSAPVRVSVNFYVRDMRIVGYNNEYSVQLTYRQQWQDERLRFDTRAEFLNSRSGSIRYVTPVNSKNEIWQPDTFFSNEIEGKYHEMMIRNQYFRIHPDGEVLASFRISLRLSCHMDYRNFPFDTQTCPLRLASYAFTTDDLVYRWKPADPVQVSSTIGNDLQNLALTQFTTDYCDAQTNTGTYSCLRVDFQFQRLFKHFLIMVYIPTMMMVFVSWVSFWISSKAVTARTLLATLTLLVLAIQVNEVNKTFPQTIYTKAVDVWTGVCLTFVFATLLEFATVHYLLNRKEKNSFTVTGSKNNENAGIELNDCGEDVEQEIPQKDMSSRGGNMGNQGQKERACQLARNCISNLESSSHRLDVVSRIAFPVLFILFNICYWSTYACFGSGSNSIITNWLNKKSNCKFRIPKNTTSILIWVIRDSSSCSRRAQQISEATHDSRCQMSQEIMKRFQSGNAEKITLYEHSNREGRWISYQITKPGCNTLPEEWDNRASSINTHHNCFVVYEQPLCSGRSERIAPGTPHHNYLEALGFDNQISSFQLCSGSGSPAPGSGPSGGRPTHRPPTGSGPVSSTYRPRPPSSDSEHRPPPSDSVHRPPPSSDLSGIRKILLDEHNIYRRRHRVPALSGDYEEVHRAAQRHAEFLASNDRFEQSNGNDYGENLAGVQGRNQEDAVRNAIRLWYKGESKYDYNNPGYNPESGGFTQMVWKSSTHVGVGVAWNPKRNWWIVVTNYDPAGNYHGQFRENVLPPY